MSDFISDDTHTNLDNVLWDCLNNAHREYTDKKNNVCVYKEGYGTIGAISVYSPESYIDLASIVKLGRTIMILGQNIPIDQRYWTKLDSIYGYQMVLDAPISRRNISPVKLGVNDTDEMVKLSVKSELMPPFTPKKLELGDFLGIKKDTLIAMGGTRFELDGYTEICSICTDPMYRRQGLGTAITCELSCDVIDDGNIPFLQVAKENVGAIKIYEKLGFRKRLQGFYDVLQRSSTLVENK